MNKVWQILKAKGNQVWTISKDATVLDALKLMTEKGISALVVMDGDKAAGIFTEKDHAKKVGALERQPRDTRVGEVMSQDLITVSPDQSVNDCMTIMTERRIRHIPVFENGHLVGLISIGDVVKDMIEELQFMVNQLENYITGLR
jgi:CBS domain-containing protein